MTNHRQRPKTAQEPGLSQPSCRQAAADSSTAGPAALLQPFGTGLNLPPATAGVDEAGRGCLAGPVVAAAVILPEKYHLPNLTDSKALSPAMREALAPRIKACALAWGIGLVWASRIDSINILQATFEAMSKAVSRLALPPAVLLIDGNKTVPVSVLAAQWQKYSVHPGMALPAQRAIVKGDTSEPAISAASVLAKTCRDQLMCRLASRWPGYGFEKHKGYGTSAHYAALEALGPCPVHRLTFRGVLPVAAEQPRSPRLQTQGSLC